MSMNIIDMTATQLSTAIRAGETTAVEAAEALLAQIEKEDKNYNCYVTVDREGALAQARAVQAKIEAGELAGPLAGVPVAVGDIEAELCTPTGAALLRTFAEEWGPMPDGVVRGCGCGCGTKDFPRANCLRAFLMDTQDRAEGPNDAVTELKANIDDMTGEELGFAMDRLLEAGALDVSYAPVYMKKNRPGVVLTCLCRPADGDRLAAEMLRYTGTFGVRRTDCARYALTVSRETAETVYGPVSRKTGTGYGLVKSKPEYDELAKIAGERDLALETVREAFFRAE